MNCEVVENMADFKTFWYCRTHKAECTILNGICGIALENEVKCREFSKPGEVNFTISASNPLKNRRGYVVFDPVQPWGSYLSFTEAEEAIAEAMVNQSLEYFRESYFEEVI